jgi:uroporphyrinogen-III synthase
MARAAKLVQQIPILMTRPKGSNRSFIDRIAPEVRERLHVVVSPLIAIEPLGAHVDIGPEDAAIFTSGNGVKYAPRGAGRRAYCVGEQTTQRARQAGWDAICAGNDATALVDKLRQIAPSQTLLHAHGVHLRVDVASQLQKAGLDVAATAVYDQILQPLTEEALGLLKGKAPVLVPLFSPRTASHFAELAPDVHRTIVIAISKAVADQCKLLDLGTVFVADEPTAQSMVKQLEKLLAEAGSG